MSERDIEIGFGTLFSVSGEENRTDVVIDVGKNGWFSTANINTTEDVINGFIWLVQLERKM